MTFQPRNPRPDPTVQTPALAQPPVEEAKKEEPPPPLLGTVSSEPPKAAPLPKETLEAIRRDVESTLRAEFEERFRAVGMSSDELTREEIEGMEMPFNDFNKKLAIFTDNGETDPIPGFHLHWINDDGDRIPRMLAMGYAFVEKEEVALNSAVTPINRDEGTYVSVYAGTDHTNKAMRTFLMKIPEAKYALRKRYEQRRNDDIMQAIRRGGPNAVGMHAGGKAYTPRDTPVTITGSISQRA